MIEIRLSNSFHGKEIELSGSPKALQNIRQSILNLIHNQERQVCMIEAATIDPVPYNVCLSSLSIGKSNTLINVSVLANSLHIAGSSKHLEIFADWFDFDDDTEFGYHNHFNYSGNEGWVDPNSSSLVISIRNIDNMAHLNEL